MTTMRGAWPLGLCFGRQAHHHIESRGQFTGARAFQWIEWNGHGVARLLILDAFPDPILLVARVALDVALRDEFLLSLHLDRKMDVRRAAGVGDGFDRAEHVFTRRASEEAAEALE